MADPKRDKSIRLDTVPDELYKAIQKDQRRLLSKLSKEVNKLTTSNGQIIINSKNIATVGRIMDLFKNQFYKSSYVLSVQNFADEFEVQKELINKIFDDEFGGVPDKDIFDEVFKQNKALAVQQLISEPVVTSVLFDPVADFLRKSVGSGAPLTDTIIGLQNLMVGDEREGLLLRHAKRVAKDAFAQTDRAYTNAVAKDLDVQFYLYSGGLIEDSRKFCIARNGGYYHELEIKKWASKSGTPKPSGDWQGKIPSTNQSTIFVNAGGYNCNHSILPVSPASVPKDVLQRNIANGNWAPTDKVKKQLGI